MRVPYEWLKEFFDISLLPEKVADRLTMIGFEVEGVESVNGDIVFEVDITPNRPDCLSIMGIARELSAAFNVPIKIPPHVIKENQPVSDFSIEILNPELCNRYTGRLITGVKISDSPDWIKVKLEKCGLRPINNVVDITNYVLFEFGHPLHAFDADTINGKKIKVDIAGKNSKITTLDGVERGLPDDALIIWDETGPIAIAGVMGGHNTEVTEKTSNIFLESAYFDPFSVRKTSKHLNLKSESSYRFERGTDIVFLESALDRAALIIKEVAGGIIHKIIDAYPVKYKTEPVKVGYKLINKLLGTDISKNEMIEILKRLGIPVEDKSRIFIVHPPAFRRDLKRESDVAEEIARVYGYDRIPTTIPRSPLSSGRIDRKKMQLDWIRNSMRNAGFTEVINYSFMNIENLDMLSIPESDIRRKVITINNPLSQDQCLLRTTLIPALIDNFTFNLDRGMKEVRLFEIAKVFIHINETLPSENSRLGGIFYKEKSPSLWKDGVQGFFIVKGAIESIFGELKLSGYSFSPSSEPFLHQGQATAISVSGEDIGYIGVLRPEIIEKLDLKKQKPEIVVFEIDIEILLKHLPDTLQYTAIPKFPSVERDIALVVDETVPSMQIRDTILSFPSELIEEVSLFDCYRGTHVPEGKKSLAFNIIYRSMERTLTDEEVERLHASIIDHIVKKTGGELRR